MKNNILENEKQEILGIGITGLVGSRIAELLGNKYDFTNLSIETGTDITNPSTLELIKISSPKSIVFHLAAKADVDSCEAEKDLGENSDAWKINVEGTRNIVEACREGGKKIIYVSTDFVFDGNKEEGGYTEEDTPNPINWYAQTKLEGEKIVKNSGLPCIIIRIAYPYRARFDLKKDFVRSMIDKFEKKEKIQAVEDHIMTPTFIDDIAFALDTLIKNNAEGIFHVVGEQFVSPYEAGLLIAKIFGFDQSLVGKTTRENYFKGCANRPFRLALKNDKIQKLGIQMRGLEEGLTEIKKQL